MTGTAHLARLLGGAGRLPPDIVNVAAAYLSNANEVLQHGTLDGSVGDKYADPSSGKRRAAVALLDAVYNPNHITRISEEVSYLEPFHASVTAHIDVNTGRMSEFERSAMTELTEFLDGARPTAGAATLPLGRQSPRDGRSPLPEAPTVKALWLPLFAQSRHSSSPQPVTLGEGVAVPRLAQEQIRQLTSVVLEQVVREAVDRSIGEHRSAHAHFRASIVSAAGRAVVPLIHGGPASGTQGVAEPHEHLQDIATALVDFPELMHLLWFLSTTAFVFGRIPLEPVDHTVVVGVPNVRVRVEQPDLPATTLARWRVLALRRLSNHQAFSYVTDSPRLCDSVHVTVRTTPDLAISPMMMKTSTWGRVSLARSRLDWARVYCKDSRALDQRVDAPGDPLLPHSTDPASRSELAEVLEGTNAFNEARPSGMTIADARRRAAEVQAGAATEVLQRIADQRRRAETGRAREECQRMIDAAQTAARYTAPRLEWARGSLLRGSPNVATPALKAAQFPFQVGKALFLRSRSVKQRVGTVDGLCAEPISRLPDRMVTADRGTSALPHDDTEVLFDDESPEEVAHAHWSARKVGRSTRFSEEEVEVTYRLTVVARVAERRGVSFAAEAFRASFAAAIVLVIGLVAWLATGLSIRRTPQNADAVVAVVLLIPGLLLARLIRPMAGSLSEWLQRTPRQLAAVSLFGLLVFSTVMVFDATERGVSVATALAFGFALCATTLATAVLSFMVIRSPLHSNYGFIVPELPHHVVANLARLAHEESGKKERRAFQPQLSKWYADLQVGLVDVLLRRWQYSDPRQKFAFGVERGSDVDEPPP